MGSQLWSLQLQQDGAAPDKIVEAKAAAQMAQSRSQKEAIKAAEDDEVIRLQIQAKQQQDAEAKQNNVRPMPPKF